MWPTLQPVWQHRPSSKCLHPDFLGISKAVRGPRPSAKGWLERKRLRTDKDDDIDDDADGDGGELRASHRYGCMHAVDDDGADGGDLIEPPLLLFV